jgi:hypothetical protein
MFHPTICIPWSAFKNRRREKTSHGDYDVFAFDEAKLWLEESCTRAFAEKLPSIAPAKESFE